MHPELEQQLQRLDERGGDLGETADLPRGALPALFRALAEAPPEDQRHAAQRLAERLADWPLVAPTLECLRAHGLAGPWAEAILAAVACGEPWCAQEQVAALLATTPDPARGLELLDLLLSEAPRDPTELALALGVEPLTTALLQVLRLRLRGSTARRDRTSARLAQGAIRALAAIAADEPEVQRAVSQLVAAETRRADKGEPTLALEALEALRETPPVARIRLLTPTIATLRTLTKRKVREQAEALRDEAAAALGLGETGLAELTARDGGLDRAGVARVPLDEGQEARLTLGADGEVAVDAPADIDREDARAIDSAQRELSDARAELARRLELALAEGRAWPTPVWRAIFSPHPLWRDLARRLTWVLVTDAATTGFDLDDAGQARTVFDEPLDLPEAGEVRLLHPAEADPEELELWRERALQRGRPAPFVQLFRGGPPAADPFARYVDRQAHKDEVGELARRSGWRGFPLEGRPPWELYRTWPDGAEVVLLLDDVPQELARTALGNLTKEARKLKRSKQPPPREAKPRVRVQGVEVRGQAGPRVLAEALRDLDDLTDPLATPTDLDLRAWQQDKWREPQDAWRELVLRYRLGSPARLEARRALLRLHLPTLRLEDRFAITRRHVIELGTGLVHEGAPKDYLPGWKAEERVEAAAPKVRLPFVPAADPETARIVRLVLGLHAWEQAQEGGAPQESRPS